MGHDGAFGHASCATRVAYCAHVIDFRRLLREQEQEQREKKIAESRCGDVIGRYLLTTGSARLDLPISYKSVMRNTLTFASDALSLTSSVKSSMRTIVSSFDLSFNNDNAFFESSQTMTLSSAENRK
jgi:hypothetical protein